MMPSRAELKARAKLSMAEHRPSVFLVTLLLIAIVYALQLLMTRIYFGNIDPYDLMLRISQGETDAFQELTDIQPGFIGQLLSIAINIMNLMLEIGFTIFCLRVARKLEAGFGELFDGFGMFLKFLLLNILLTVFVFLWSCLLIVPGIIASYRYRMANYILIDNPELSALECLRRSKEMMQGHKMELFVLDLSFILWNLLCVIPFVSVYVTPYKSLTLAHYYNVLSGAFLPFSEEKGSEKDF